MSSTSCNSRNSLAVSKISKCVQNLKLAKSNPRIKIFTNPSFSKMNNRTGEYDSNSSTIRIAKCLINSL